jgi:hypothetical protein
VEAMQASQLSLFLAVLVEIQTEQRRSIFGFDGPKRKLERKLDQVSLPAAHVGFCESFLGLNFCGSLLQLF